MGSDEFARIMMDGRLNRRQMIARLTALGLSAPVAATLAARAVPASAAPAAIASRAARAQGSGNGTLIVGTETDIEGMDPGHAGALATTRVNINVLEGLVKYDPGTVDLIPHLALEVPSVENGGVSEDGLTYTFNLRPDVKFHDGADFNAEAVVMSYRRLYDPDFEFYDDTNTSGFFLAGMTNVEAVDDMTVRFTLAEPNAAFVELSNIYSGKVDEPEGHSRSADPAMGRGQLRNRTVQALELGKGRQRGSGAERPVLGHATGPADAGLPSHSRTNRPRRRAPQRRGRHDRRRPTGRHPVDQG